MGRRFPKLPGKGGWKKINEMRRQKILNAEELTEEEKMELLMALGLV